MKRKQRLNFRQQGMSWIQVQVLEIIFHWHAGSSFHFIDKITEDFYRLSPDDFIFIVDNKQRDAC